MKALSLLQPWAQLVVCGAKCCETRSWRTQHRGRICIHASARMNSCDKRLLTCRNEWSEAVWRGLGLSCLQLDCDRFPQGGIVGIAEIVACYPTREFCTEKRYSVLATERELILGDYGPNRWAWHLINPFEFSEPIPCTGKLGLWDVPSAIVGQVNKLAK